MKYLKMFEAFEPDYYDLLQEIIESIPGASELGVTNFNTDTPTLSIECDPKDFKLVSITLKEGTAILESLGFIHDASDYEIYEDSNFFIIEEIPKIATELVNRNGFELASELSCGYTASKNMEMCITIRKSKEMSDKYRGGISAKKFGF